jgi:hypothetical protein
MAKLKPGDRVDCRVKQAAIVSPYKDYDEIKTFEIIAADKYGYYLYVPVYLSLKGAVKADKSQCKHLGIDKRFLDENMVYIQENMICKISAVLDGMRCVKCREFYALAEANQDDGTLICWSCRNYPHYR